MDRRRFLNQIGIAIAIGPALACSEAAGSRGSDEIRITVHKDPG